MRRVLVTGSEGGIGRYLVAALEARPGPDGFEVRRVNRYPGLELTSGDLRDRVFAHAMTHGMDTVIHAAARRYAPADTASYPFDTIAHDIDVATSVLEAALDAGVRHVVLLSSATIYNQKIWDEVGGGGARLVEGDDLFVPSSPVGIAKLAIEHAVRAWSQQSGGTFTIWRLCHVVTPLERHDRSAHAWVDLYRKIFVERLPRIAITNATQSRICTWVGDVADAIANHVTSTRAINQTFNLASEDEHSLLEVANELVAAGRRGRYLPDDYVPVIETDAKWHSSRGLPNMAAARARLGWTAPTSFQACIDRFVVGKAEIELRERARDSRPVLPFGGPAWSTPA